MTLLTILHATPGETSLLSAFSGRLLANADGRLSVCDLDCCPPDNVPACTCTAVSVYFDTGGTCSTFDGETFNLTLSGVLWTWSGTRHGLAVTVTVYPWLTKPKVLVSIAGVSHTYTWSGSWSCTTPFSVGDLTKTFAPFGTCVNPWYLASIYVACT